MYQKTTIDKIKDQLRKILRKCKNIAKLVIKSDVDVFKYVYYNYFCKKVVRTSSSHIVPHKNAILDLQGNAKIILSGDKDLEIGINKLKGSKAETYLRMMMGRRNCSNGADLFYNTVVEIKPDAVFNTGYFSANGGSVIIAHKNINFGEDVMLEGMLLYMTVIFILYIIEMEVHAIHQNLLL